MYNYRFFNTIKIILFVWLILITLHSGFKILSYMGNHNKNITTEIKVGKIIDSSKENINGLIEGHIQYETAIKVDGEIIISDDKDVYYEAKDKIGKEVKVKIENDKNINTKSILDID